jgi:hypothetical protein
VLIASESRSIVLGAERGDGDTWGEDTTVLGMSSTLRCENTRDECERTESEGSDKATMDSESDSELLGDDVDMRMISYSSCARSLTHSSSSSPFAVGRRFPDRPAVVFPRAWTYPL